MRSCHRKSRTPQQWKDLGFGGWLQLAQPVWQENTVVSLTESSCARFHASLPTGFTNRKAGRIFKVEYSRALFCFAVMVPYPPICRDGKDKRNETKADYILVQIG